MNIHFKRQGLQAGFTLVELMMTISIFSVMAGGLLVGSIVIQKSFSASRYHVVAQAQQMRLMDWIALDLRRALSVTPTADSLTLTIPDYYVTDPSTGEQTPREPAMKSGLASYGGDPITVRYFKGGDTIYRQEGISETALATDVENFTMKFQDSGRSISASITFAPKFAFSGPASNEARNGTAVFTTTLLRNKRQN
ncbi:MAG: prepilin-type N-terminal cleavage/methylation domain-containing protein [Verrucomicrobiota bacterium]|nr:prepilin-type N-terminal cleavage/methylation domain-containing protein [Verrucomicrobiota bacterium]